MKVSWHSNVIWHFNFFKPAIFAKEIRTEHEIQQKGNYMLTSLCH